MWLLLKGPTGHLRSHGQRVNNFKSHSPADFWSGLTKPMGLHTSSDNFQSTFPHPPSPPPFFNDYYFRTLSGRGGVFWCKRLLLWRRVGGPQQTSTKLGFLRLGKCEGGGGANHNQALSVKMRNLCLFGLARPLDWVSQGYLRFYFLCTPYGITSWLFENSSTGLPAPECFQ